MLPTAVENGKECSFYNQLTMGTEPWGMYLGIHSYGCRTHFTHFRKHAEIPYKRKLQMEVKRHTTDYNRLGIGASNQKRRNETLVPIERINLQYSLADQE
jgi:hypothetical protein